MVLLPGCKCCGETVCCDPEKVSMRGGGHIYAEKVYDGTYLPGDLGDFSFSGTEADWEGSTGPTTVEGNATPGHAQTDSCGPWSRGRVFVRAGVPYYGSQYRFEFLFHWLDYYPTVLIESQDKFDTTDGVNFSGYRVNIVSVAIDGVPVAVASDGEYLGTVAFYPDFLPPPTIQPLPPNGPPPDPTIKILPIKPAQFGGKFDVVYVVERWENFSTGDWVNTQNINGNVSVDWPDKSTMDDCGGGGGGGGGECQGCTTSFSKVTNAITTQYGVSSGGYLFNSIFAALPSYWPNNAVHPNPLPYNDRLVLTYNGVEYKNWNIYGRWNSGLGERWLQILPAEFPLLQSDPEWGDFLYHQSPVSVIVNHTKGYAGPPDDSRVPHSGIYCTAAADIRFHVSRDSGAYWYADEYNNKFNCTINGERLGSVWGPLFGVQKTSPQIVFPVNSSTTPPRTLDSVSFAGVSGDGTDAVMLVPSLIDESSITANWGTRNPVPYKVVPTGDWIDNDVLSFSFTEGKWVGTIQTGTPFPPEPGKSHDVVVQWGEMLSISEACRNVNPNPLP